MWKLKEDSPVATVTLSHSLHGDLITVSRQVLKVLAPVVLDIADLAKHLPGIAAGHVPPGIGTYFTTAIDQFGPCTFDKRGWVFPEFLQVGYYEHGTALAWYHLSVTGNNQMVRSQWMDMVGHTFEHGEVCAQILRSRVNSFQTPQDA